MLTKDLIKRIVEDAASGFDRFSNKECVELIREDELEPDQCKALQKVYGYGRDMAITPDKIKYLGEDKFDFSDKIISGLAAEGGMRAFNARAKWLSDEYIKNGLTKEDRIRIENEIRNMGADAAKAIPALVKMVDKVTLRTWKDVGLARDAVYQLGEIGDRLRKTKPKSKKEAAAKAKAVKAMALAIPVISKIFQLKADETTEKDLSYIIGSAKATAIVALGKIGIKEGAVPILVKALDDEYGALRPLAMESIEALNAQEALYEIIIAWARLKSKAAKNEGTLEGDDVDLYNEITAAFKVWDVRKRLVVGNLMRVMNGEKDETIETRIYAIEAIGRLGGHAAPAVQYLIGFLDDVFLKEAAANALVAIGGQSAIKALHEANTETTRKALAGMLNDDDVGKRKAAAILLGSMGATEDEAIAGLIEMLGNEDEAEEPRTYAAASLGKIGDARAIPSLIKALDPKYLRIARKAAWALGRMGPDARPAVNALMKAYGSDDEQLIVNSATALGEIGSKAKKAFYRLAKGLRDKRPEVVKASAMAMIKIDPDRAVKEIKAMRDRAVLLVPKLKEYLGEIDDEAIKRACALALANLGESARDAVPELTQALESESVSLKKAAIFALGRIGPAAENAVSTIESEMYKSKSAGVRAEAAKALGMIGLGVPEVLPALLRAMMDKSKKVTRAARAAIKGFDKSELIPKLRNILHEEGDSDDLRSVAEEALAMVGVKEEPEVAAVEKPKPEPKAAKEPTRAELLEDLVSQDFATRFAAVESLVKMGEKAKKAVPQIVEILDGNEDPKVRYAAAFVLSSLGDVAERALPDLYRAMRKDSDQKVRKECQKALDAAASKKMVAKFVKALKHKEEYVRQYGAYMLMKVGPDAAWAVPDLLAVLKDGKTDKGLAVMIVKALAVIGSDRAVIGLAKAMRGADFEVGFAIAEGLVKLGPEAKGAVPILEGISKGADEGAKKLAEFVLKEITH